MLVVVKGGWFMLFLVTATPLQRHISNFFCRGIQRLLLCGPKFPQNSSVWNGVGDYA